jgi:hypothetical protein
MAIWRLTIEQVSSMRHGEDSAGSIFLPDERDFLGNSLLVSLLVDHLMRGCGSHLIPE